jgi:hypothetical protein
LDPKRKILLKIRGPLRRISRPGREKISDQTGGKAIGKKIHPYQAIGVLTPPKNSGCTRQRGPKGQNSREQWGSRISKEGESQR